jgi:regulatory protein RepA
MNTAPDYAAHTAYLASRGIDDAVRKVASMQFLTAGETRQETGVASPSIRIPYFDVDGEPIDFARWRMLDPSATQSGNKFHQKAKTGVFAYFPPLPRNVRRKWAKILKDAKMPLIITEGEIKSLAATKRGMMCIGIGGVNSWQVGGKPLAVWASINWKNRTVEICFDSDQATNRNVQRAQIEFADYLTSLGAVVSIRVLYDATSTGKTGLDDFLAAVGVEAYQQAPLYPINSPTVDKWRAQLTDTAELPDFDLCPVPTEWFDTKLPPMEFTVEGYLPTGVCALLVAEGGVGKTNFALQLAESVATGEPFFGLKTRGGTVVVLALEDPPEVLRRRIHRIQESRSADLTFQKETAREKRYAKAIRKHLVLASLVGQQLHMVGMTRGVVAQSPALDALIAKLKGNDVALVILDPMSRLHGADENANAIGTAVVNAAERIAREVGCTVLISHHTGKASATSQNETAYAARGASGIADAARVVLRLRQIDDKEAGRIDNLEPDELARGVLRLVHAKSNYAPKVDDLWLKRGECGEFTSFVPQFKDAADDYSAFLSKVRAWAALRRTTFTKRAVTATDLKEIFNGTVSQQAARTMMDDAIKRGDIIVTGAKSKGGGDSLSMKEIADAAPRKF